MGNDRGSFSGQELREMGISPVEMGISCGEIPQKKNFPLRNSNLKKNNKFCDFSPREKSNFPGLVGGEIQFLSGEVHFLQTRNSDVTGRNSGIT